jgi:hypothetical protein
MQEYKTKKRSAYGEKPDGEASAHMQAQVFTGFGTLTNRITLIKMKTVTQSFLSLFLSFLCLCPLGAQAAEVTIGGLKYDLVTGEEDAPNTATVTGRTAEMPAELTIPTTVEKDGVTYSVTAIGSEAFEDCYGLTSVVFPASLKTIGDGAFQYCYALASATLSDGSKLTSIGEGAFFYCEELASVTLTNATSLESIGGAAFDGCTKLADVTLTGADKLATIGDYAFRGIALKTVDLSWFTGLKSIGYQAFYESKVEKLWLPESLESIGGYAFEDCYALTEAMFLKKDGSSGSMVPGDGSKLETIGTSAFSGCTALGKVVLTNAASLTSIGSEAFRNTKLTDMTLTNAASLESIGSAAFYGSGLTSLDFVLAGATGLTTIGDGAFLGCTDMASVKFPASLESIDYGAFKNCAALGTVTLTSAPPELGEDAFAGIPADCAFEVEPPASLADYQAAPTWAGLFPTPEPADPEIEDPDDPEDDGDPADGDDEEDEDDPVEEDDTNTDPVEEDDDEDDPEETEEEGSGSGSGTGSNGVVAWFRVTFLQGKDILYQTTVRRDGVVPIVPVLEEREGYTLSWFAAPDSAAIWDFSTPVTAALTLSPSGLPTKTKRPSSPLPPPPWKQPSTISAGNYCGAPP